MSIIPTEWSIKDSKGLVPDISLRQATVFNTDDGFLYRIVDFIMVQEPGTEYPVYPESRKGEAVQPSYMALSEGDKRWYIVLKTEDGNASRTAYRYADFDSMDNFHRVKSSKPASAIRSLDPQEPVELSSRHRPSSVDHSTGVVKGPRNVDPGTADFDYRGDSVMVEERENPSGDWKPSQEERERLRGGAAAYADAVRNG